MIRGSFPHRQRSHEKALYHCKSTLHFKPIIIKEVRYSVELKYLPFRVRMQVIEIDAYTNSYNYRKTVYDYAGMLRPLSGKFW
jgi:hypothetical protein